MSSIPKSGEGRAPFTREEVVVETRKAALAVASLIAAFGQDGSARAVAEDYLGVQFDDYCLSRKTAEHLSAIPIEKHFLYRVTMDAYDYAYQVGARSLDYTAQIDERMHEVTAILTGFPQTDFDGEPSPLDRSNPEKLRQVLETFLARYSLDQEYDLSIRELALLANMGEAAVRTSLSKDGITTISKHKGQPGVVPHAQALSWLLGRRGFVPSAKWGDEREDQQSKAVLESLLKEGKLEFPKFLELALQKRGLDFETFAEATGVSGRWLNSAIHIEDTIKFDLDEVVKISRALELPVTLFAARAVEYFLDPNRINRLALSEEPKAGSS